MILFIPLLKFVRFLTLFFKVERYGKWLSFARIMPVLIRKRSFSECFMMEPGANSCCSSFFPCDVLFTFWRALWKQLLKSGHFSCHGAVQICCMKDDKVLNYSSIPDFHSRRKQGKKVSEDKSRLRCEVMFWTKLSKKHNFTNRTIFLLN